MSFHLKINMRAPRLLSERKFTGGCPDVKQGLHRSHAPHLEHYVPEMGADSLPLGANAEK
jgi:hypothetical protein